MTTTALAAEVSDAIRAGDEKRARELVVRLDERDRRALRPAVAEQVAWQRRHRGQSRPQGRAASLASIGTATARRVAADFLWWYQFDLSDEADLEALYEVLAARGRSFVETVTRGLIEEGRQQQWLLVRRAVRSGLIEPPDRDAYIRGMVRGVGGPLHLADPDSMYQALVADPALLDEEVWRLFEVDCSSELTTSWQRALVRLGAEGRLDRARLLDESLAALMRDFRPSLVDWYAKFHEALEPTTAEREARLEQYLALLTSPAPTVVKEGLAALRAVEAVVPPEALARASTGPLTQRQKNLAVDMLRLLARSAQRHPEARPAVLEAVAAALGHDRSDVQERALSLLETYPEDTPRAALLGVADAASPTLRARVDALTGLDAGISEAPHVHASGDLETRLSRLPAEAGRAAGAEDALAAVAAGRWPPPAYPVMTPDLLRRVGTPLAPVASVDELIELAAMLLEGQGSGDDVERFVDGVSRLCDKQPPGFQRRAAGLLKQADVFLAPMPGRDLVASLVRAWVTRKRLHKVPALPSGYGFLGERVAEVASRARTGHARPLLAFPTHAGGWIDPDALDERLRRTGRIRNRPQAADQLQAHARAFPGVEPISFTPTIETKRHAWGDSERRVVMRADRVPGHHPQWVDDALRALDRHPPQSELWAYDFAWSGWDTLGARWLVTALPTLPEVGFAHAVPRLMWSLDGSAQHSSAAVLGHALDADVPLGSAAWLAVAGSLVAKSPDMHRVGTDIVVNSISDGRFDVDGLATGLAWLVEQKLAKMSRLEAPLRDAARVSPLHAAKVVRTVEAFMGQCTETPHGAHTVIEVALESATRIGYGLETDGGRAALERAAAQVSRSSKLGRVARGLADARPAEAVAAGLRAAAAATAIERAERYADGLGDPAPSAR